MSPGHLACRDAAPGGSPCASRVKALGRNSVFTFPACCWSVIDGGSPFHPRVPLFHTRSKRPPPPPRAPGGARDEGDPRPTSRLGGRRRDFRHRPPGACGAAERNDDIIYVCYDNEAYMNTGIQRSERNPLRRMDHHHPHQEFQDGNKKDIKEIMAAHRVPYLATAFSGWPLSRISKKIVKAKEIRGFKFIHILAPCPPGWKGEAGGFGQAGPAGGADRRVSPL